MLAYSLDKASVLYAFNEDRSGLLGKHSKVDSNFNL